MTERDRDGTGRARNSRPRDGLGRPLPHGAAGEERIPDDLVLPPQDIVTAVSHGDVQESCDGFDRIELLPPLPEGDEGFCEGNLFDTSSEEQI